MRAVRFLFAVTLLACAAVAQNNGSFREWEPPPNEKHVVPKLACAQLRALTGFDMSVVSAESVPAGTGVPAHCRVTGQVLPQVGFLVDLPNSWNRRLYMFGNGRFAGQRVDERLSAGLRASALEAGFAVTATDTGHDEAAEPLASFARDRQKFIDYAFRSLHVAALAAKRVIEAYYGDAPARSYFDGCSTGGRQALILAQRFPNDFDGIIAGAPVLNFTGTMVAYSVSVRALEGAPFNEVKVKLLAQRVYDYCDAKDGMKDGIIGDPRACDFKPSRDLPPCVENKDAPNCFTAAQAAALEKVYGDISVGGSRFFPGRPLSAEGIGSNGRPAWAPWLVNDQGPTVARTFAESFFKYMAFPPNDPAAELAKVDLDRDMPRLAPVHQALDATDPDLSAFRARGGKLLMYFGWADPALNPRMGLEYYEAVLRQMGAETPAFFRLFMVPGMFHCNGGVGPNSFDAITTTVRWVEAGAPPDRISASQIASGKVERTRPLCPHPQIAKYKGSGNPNDQGSFTCAVP